MAGKVKKFIWVLWKITYRTVVIFITLAALSIGFLLFHLNKKPLDLEFLMPEIQKYVLPENSGLTLEADSILLTAQLTRRGLFHINIKNMSLLGKGEVLILDLPAVEVSYGLLSLLTLNYIPKSVRIDDALLQLTLTKNEELLLHGQTSDALDVETTSDAEDTSDVKDVEASDTVDAAEKESISEAEKSLVVRDMRRVGDFLLKFRRLALNRAAVIIADEKTGKRIIVPQLNFALKRRRFIKYDIEIDTAVRMQRDLMSFKGNATYNSVAQTVEFDAFFNRLNLSRFGRAIPLLDGLRVLLRGEINGSLDIAEGAVHWRNAFKALSFSVSTVQPGEIQLPAPLNTVYPVKSLTANGSFSENLEALKVQPAKSSLTTGLTANVDMTVKGIGDFLDKDDFNLVNTTLNARLKDIPMKEVPAVWPSYLGPTAHEWVKTNLKSGTATTALFTLYFKGGTIADLIGDIDFKNATVDYLSPMKPVTNAGGKVMLYPDKVEVFANTGKINNIQLKKADVYLTDLQAETGKAKIELDVTGPSPEILALINEKPLSLLSDFGINPDKTKGNISGTAALSFPLSESMTVKDVTVDVKANVSDGYFATPDDKASLHQVNADLVVDNEKMVINGTGAYEGLPLQLKWEEFFMPTDKKPTKSIYTVKGSVSDTFFKTYFKDISDYIVGTVDGQVIFRQSKNKSASVVVNADLSKSEIMMYPISYTKVNGVPSTFSGEINLNSKSEIELARFEWDADKKSLDIAGLYQVKGNKTEVTLNKVKAPGTSFSMQLSYNEKEDISLKLKGNSWLMTEIKNTPYFKKQTVESETEQPQTPKVANDLTPLPSIDVDVSMDTMTLNAQAPLKKVGIKAKRTGLTWQELFVYAQGNDAFSISLNPQTNKIEGLANDIGDLLNRFNFSKEFEHGKAVLSATQNEFGHINGEVTVKDLDFKNPGFIMQAVTVLGIVDAVRGKELNFSTGSIPFELSPRLNLTINDGVLYGTSLGVTFTGTASPDVLDMSGSVIPAYAVNSLPGRIPVIGGLFRSAPNGGLMGVKFDLKGTPTAPNVNFNPLSSIAPGILGRLFQ